MPDRESVDLFFVGTSFRVGKGGPASTCVGHAILTEDILFLVVVRSQFESIMKVATGPSLASAAIDEVFNKERRAMRKGAKQETLVCKCKELPIQVRSVNNGWPKGTHNLDVICVLRETVEQMNYSRTGGLFFNVGDQPFRVRPSFGKGKKTLSKLKDWGWAI